MDNFRFAGIESGAAWQENEVYEIRSISFANNGIIADGPGWTYYQTSNQAFYLFEELAIEGIEPDELDVIGAFKNDVCVGWINYDEMDLQLLLWGASQMVVIHSI